MSEDNAGKMNEYRLTNALTIAHDALHLAFGHVQAADSHTLSDILERICNARDNAQRVLDESHQRLGNVPVQPVPQGEAQPLESGQLEAARLVRTLIGFLREMSEKMKSAYGQSLFGTFLEMADTAMNQAYFCELQLRGVLEKMRLPTDTAYDLLMKEGGEWIGAARSRVQCMFHNGEHVTWGTNDALRPPVTIRQIEEIAAAAVAADRQARNGRMRMLTREEVAPFFKQTPTPTLTLETSKEEP